MVPFGLIGSWSPGIGDPSFAGWLTVVAYLVAAWLCWRALTRAAGRRGRAALGVGVAGLRSLRRPLRGHGPAEGVAVARLAALWLCLATLMLFLGLNKQLDLQTALTEAGRIVARSQGWYEGRRVVQVAFIALVGAAGLAGVGATVLLARGSAKRLRLALIGAALVVTFVVLRASSFHHIDRLLGLEVGGLRVNWVVELGGIACVALSAWRNGSPSARIHPRASGADPKRNR